MTGPIDRDERRLQIGATIGLVLVLVTGFGFLAFIWTVLS